MATELSPETTSNPVTHGPRGRDSSTAPPASRKPKPTNEPFITSCRGEQYAAEQPGEGTETLSDIETTYSEVGEARDAASDGSFLDAFGHVREAWGAKPDLDSIRQLVGIAEQVDPLVEQVEVLLPVYYGVLSTVTDNFASDEIVSTLTVMAVAFGLALVLGRTVGFWVRRGQPGLISMALQRLGARVFRPWYVNNLPYALGGALHGAARERIQRDIVDDPEATLDPETFRELELYFAARREAESAP